MTEILCQLLVSDINYGVEYKYLAPTPPRTRHHGRRRPGSSGHYKWSLQVVGVCSRSCGGGVQRLVSRCVRRRGGRTAPEHRCDADLRPGDRTVACNRSPCPPAWVPGHWSHCSVSCGHGTQERRASCRQELAGGVTIPVSPDLCPDSGDSGLVTRRQCDMGECSDLRHDVMATQPQSSADHDWVAQSWSPCSVSCGQGVMERQVRLS